MERDPLQIESNIFKHIQTYSNMDSVQNTSGVLLSDIHLMIDPNWTNGQSSERGYLGQILPVLDKPHTTFEEIMQRSHFHATKQTYVIAALKKGMHGGQIRRTIRKGNKRLFAGNTFTRIDIVLGLAVRTIQKWLRNRLADRRATKYASNPN
jgi:hypothetical protein